jgi:hypothetical protein
VSPVLDIVLNLEGATLCLLHQGLHLPRRDEAVFEGADEEDGHSIQGILCLVGHRFRLKRVRKGRKGNMTLIMSLREVNVFSRITPFILYLNGSSLAM